jgi:hypothetical protein
VLILNMIDMNNYICKEKCGTSFSSRKITTNGKCTNRTTSLYITSSLMIGLFHLGIFFLHSFHLVTTTSHFVFFYIFLLTLLINKIYYGKRYKFTRIS